MSDISKCNGESCPLRLSCKRYLDEASPYQSWIAPPFKNGKCEMYWDLTLTHPAESNETL